MKQEITFTAYEEISTAGAVAQAFQEIDLLMQEFINRFASNSEQLIDFEIQGKSGRTTSHKLFTHVITHEFHHKGQILSISRQLGYNPVDTDIMR